MTKYNNYWNAEDEEIDNLFCKEYRKGRKNGLSLDDAIRNANNIALSRLKTIQEHKEVV